MRILVTGGAGFVGSHVTRRLVEQGHEVTITSNGAEHDVPGVKKILYLSLGPIAWEHALNQDAIIHLMANNDTLCHDEEQMHRTNVEQPAYLFRAAYEAGCRRFVYASSTAVYGDSPAPYVEDETPIKPLNPYAQSKAEFDVFAMTMPTDAAVIGLRYCNIYGPGEEHKGRRMSMIGQMIRKALRGETIKLFEFGEQKRDWVYIDDVAEANMLALERTLNPGNKMICNIGSGRATSFNELVETISEVSGIAIHPEYVKCSFSAAFQNHTECNIEKAWRALLYSPRFDVRSGIKAYYQSLTSCGSCTAATR